MSEITIQYQQFHMTQSNTFSRLSPLFSSSQMLYNLAPHHLPPGSPLDSPLQPVLESSQPIWLTVLRKHYGISLLVQWLKICLPMQGTQVQFLDWKDSICRGATKACESQLLKPTGSRAHALQQEKPPHWVACALQLESSSCSPQFKKVAVSQPK